MYQAITKHIVFNSGGIGSWSALCRVIERHGPGSVVNLFTDTLIEDRDLYRFLIETTAAALDLDRPTELLRRCSEIPDIHTEADVECRKKLLPEIAEEAMRLIPGFIWLADGRTPWDVFFDEKYLGNSRLAHCSHNLKQDVADRYVRTNYNPEDCVLYLGIDWTEDHRKAAPIANWAPYRVEFPMCEEPYVDKSDMLADLDSLGIARPRLYGLGFAHNNCGGFCVRGGHGHFTNLYERFREQYAYHESKEEEFRATLGKSVSMMKKERRVGPDKKRTSFPYTMRQLREDITVGAKVDRLDLGGCGCFVSAS